MSSARYLFRLDDITPTMNWKRFSRVLSLFEAHGVKPLLGIVPDNHDPALMVEPGRPEFWDEMRSLKERNLIEIAQHGYRHELQARPGASILGAQYGFKERTEFAGEPFDSQVAKISAGQAILRAHGLETPYWFAPSHAYDVTTLRALRECGFTAVSDGISLFPYEEQGLVFIPQQFAKPVWMPLGVVTICLHSNSTTERTFRAIERFLKRSPHCTSFSEEVGKYRRKQVHVWMNTSFRPLYRRTWRMKSCLTRLLRPSHAAPAPLREPSSEASSHFGHPGEAIS